MTNSVIAFAGIFTCIQMGFQVAASTLSVAQYFCLIDILRELPVLIFIKIIFYHNHSVCGSTVSLGANVPGLNPQALVLFTRTPFTATRTFIIACLSLGLGVLWFLASIILMTCKRDGVAVKWPWMSVGIAVCALDLAATINYMNDSFVTKTLSDTARHIGIIPSGVSTVQVDTSAAALTMLALHVRLGIFFLVNVLLLILVGLTKKKGAVVVEDTISEAPSTRVLYARRETIADENQSVEVPWTFEPDRIPRATLAAKTDPSIDRKVKYIAKVLSNKDNKEVMTERQNDVEISMSGASSQPVTIPPPPPEPPTAAGPSNSTTHQQSAKPAEIHRGDSNKTEGGRVEAGTAELQRALPWSYVPSWSSPRRARLPPDEELPPVPLPDYTLVLNPRKASVHRSPSNLGPIQSARPRNMSTALFTQSQLKESDVLY